MERGPARQTALADVAPGEVAVLAVDDGEEDRVVGGAGELRDGGDGVGAGGELVEGGLELGRVDGDARVRDRLAELREVLPQHARRVRQVPRHHDVVGDPVRQQRQPLAHRRVHAEAGVAVRRHPVVGVVVALGFGMLAINNFGYTLFWLYLWVGIGIDIAK